MGGSHLAADLISIWKPELDLVVWSDYGLPPLKDLKERLIIASSHSGNTEEVIDVFEEALKRQLHTVAVSTGGKLVALADLIRTPYVLVPQTHIQPRSALGYSLMAILTAMGEKKAISELSKLERLLSPRRYKNSGKALARRLKGRVPVIYSSQRNKAIAYNWKIKFNETGKIPAFCGAFPELNHNEMTGFDSKGKTKPLSKKFYFIILMDEKDNSKIKKRMRVLAGLYRQRGLSVEIIPLRGQNIWLKIFSSLILADWASYYTACEYGVEPEQVPMVEEFKKLIA